MTSIFFSYPLLGAKYLDLVNRGPCAAALELDSWAKRKFGAQLSEITLIGIPFWFDCHSCQRDATHSGPDVCRGGTRKPLKHRRTEYLKNFLFIPPLTPFLRVSRVFIRGTGDLSKLSADC